jgi:hypothetical protein
MKLRIITLAMASAMIVLPTPAMAGASADFSGCDGLKKPKRKDDGMRGDATVSSFRGIRNSSPAGVVSSCNRALANKKLRPEQTLRRAHLLRARAVANLELGKLDKALVDLDAAETELTGYRGEFFFDRSMGASLDLLRAIVLSDKGQGDEAVALAEGAAAKRPYAMQIQQAATLVRDLNAPEDAVKDEIWADLVRIDPGARGIAKKRDMSDLSFEEQVEAAGDELGDLPPPPGLATITGRNAGRALSEWARAYEDRVKLGYALATLGMNDEARARLAEVELALAIEDAPESTKESDKESSNESDAEDAVESTEEDASEDANGDEGDAADIDAESPEQDNESRKDKKKKADERVAKQLVQLIAGARIKSLQKLAKARIAVSEDRLDDVVTGLEGMSLRSSPITVELYAAYDAALAARGESEPKLTELLPPAKRNASKLAGYAQHLRLRPESKRKVIDYKKSRPNILGAIVGGAFSLGTSLLGGIQRTAGFRSTPNDDGTVKVEYTGNTTSGPVVQEMTLLRAAELTQEAGKSHFLISNRKDFQRYLTSTQYGVELSRTLTGYKTELVVQYLDDGDSEVSALNAVAVIDELGPVYYSEKQSAQ